MMMGGKGGMGGGRGGMGKGPMMEDEDELMGGMDSLMLVTDEESPEAAEKGKKPGSNFDIAADRAFAAASNGDSAGFRSALRSAIKIVVADMT